MISHGVGHQISCLGVCYANDPPNGGYSMHAPALDLTTSLRSPKVVQSAKGGKGKDKRETIIVVFKSPCHENPAYAHTDAHKSVLESANPAWTRSVHLDAPGQRQGQQPVSGTANPGIVKQDKSSRGSVDTTKTRSEPQRVGMCNGGRPIGAAKGKQTKTMALCHPPPPPPTYHSY